MKHVRLLPLLCLASLAQADDFCVVPNAPIPDNNASGIVIPIEVVASAGEVIDSIEVALDIAHPWVGDLVISLRSPEGTTATLLDRPGVPSVGFPGPFGCGGRDLDAVFSDGAGVLGEDVCSFDAQPVIAGLVVPTQSLSAFASEPAGGMWELTLSDRSAYDTGVLLEACLITTTSSVCTPDLNGDGLLDFFDISAFLSGFTAMDPAADFTGDGLYDFFDVSAFLGAFAAGCP
ncbi:MAG: GC-type dockerin domain-anchored protein [Phycisphaerales bacterium JB047]